MPTETVFCLKRSIFDKMGTFNGILPHYQLQYLQAILLRRNQAWQQRPQVETNTNLKQVIPYTIIQDGNTGKVMSYTRSDKSGEVRLHSKRSFGIGGHITWEEDVPVISQSELRAVGQRTFTYEGLLEACNRERMEEILIRSNRTVGSIPNYTTIVGFVNDERDEVSQVHLGVVCVHRIYNCFVEPHKKTGKEIIDIQWYDPADPEMLEQVSDSPYELWSQHCMLNMQELVNLADTQ